MNKYAIHKQNTTPANAGLISKQNSVNTDIPINVFFISK